MSKRQHVDVGFHNIKPIIEAKRYREAIETIDRRLEIYKGNEFLLAVRANLVLLAEKEEPTHA